VVYKSVDLITQDAKQSLYSLQSQSGDTSVLIKLVPWRPASSRTHGRFTIYASTLGGLKVMVRRISSLWSIGLGLKNVLRRARMIIQLDGKVKKSCRYNLCTV